MASTLINASAVAVLAGLALTAGSSPTPDTCAGQVQVNPSFEQGSTGWTAGPRVVVLAGPDRPAHTGQAHATFAGLDVTRSDSLRSATVTIPAGCALTVQFFARASSTETRRGDYLNVGLAVTGVPPKTRFSFAFDQAGQWQPYNMGAGAAATDRTATIGFYASETAGNGVTTFDVDDVTATLYPGSAVPSGSAANM